MAIPDQLRARTPPTGDLATEALGLGFTLGVFIFGAQEYWPSLKLLLGANSILNFWLPTSPPGACDPFGD